MVNFNKKAFGAKGPNFAGYRIYTTDKLPEALEIVLFNTYIQLPMVGNASPFIAHLYLSWCEYYYVAKVVKTDYAITKLLSCNCRYLDDICTVNLKYFGDVAKDIYDITLLFER